MLEIDRKQMSAARSFRTLPEKPRKTPERENPSRENRPVKMPDQPLPLMFERLKRAIWNDDKSRVRRLERQIDLLLPPLND